VRPDGVATVMGHFFAGLNLTGQPRAPVAEDAKAARVAAANAAMANEDLACEEAMLEAFNAA
jgi:hypothetical protein